MIFSTEFRTTKKNIWSETERKLKKKENELSELRAKSVNRQKEMKADKKKRNEEFREFIESTSEDALKMLQKKHGHEDSKVGLVNKLFEEERDNLNETLAIQIEYIENLKEGTTQCC